MNSECISKLNPTFNIKNFQHTFQNKIKKLAKKLNFNKKNLEKEFQIKPKPKF